MSIMICSECEKAVPKEDFWKYDFENDLCEDCSIEREEDV
jgi:hypothetical protein